MVEVEVKCSACGAEYRQGFAFGSPAIVYCCGACGSRHVSSELSGIPVLVISERGVEDGELLADDSIKVRS